MSADPVDLQPVSITIAAATTILPVTSVSVGTGLVNQQLRHSGNRSTSTVLFSGGQNEITLTMPVQIALDTFAMGQVTAYTDLKIFMAKFNTDGNRETGANHIAWQSTGGIVIPVSFNAQWPSIVTATVRIIPFGSDDTADPLAELTGQTLPSLAEEPALHTMGPMESNGVRVDGMTTFDFALNNNLEVLRSSGTRYPDRVLYEGANPGFSSSSANVEDLIALAGFSGAVKATDVDFYLRENDEAAGTLKATGIKLSMGSSLIEIESTSLTQDSTTPVQFTVTGLEQDPVAFPVAYTASATIP